MFHTSTHIERPHPYCVFKGDDRDFRGRKSPEIEEKLDDHEGKKRWIRCKPCGNKITHAACRVTVNGRHKHVFNNPAGYVFEIGCFSMAEGCARKGQPTLEFTWFTGYHWSFAVCAACQAHLGWVYQAGSGEAFYGLILTQLIEEN